MEKLRSKTGTHSCRILMTEEKEEELSQMQLFFKYGKDLKVTEENGKLIITAKFEVANPENWIGVFGSNG